MNNNIKSKLCILLLSLGFLLAFSAFMIASQASQIVMEDARTQSNGTFKGSGFVSLSLIYTSFAFFNFFVPPVINFVGPCIGLSIGIIPYALYVASFLNPKEWSLYLSAILVGAGAGLTWTGQVMYINEWSTKENLNTHFSIFYGIYEGSAVIGGLVYYFILSDKKEIDETTRYKIFVPFTVLLVVSSILFALMPRNKKSKEPVSSSEEAIASTSSTEEAVPEEKLSFSQSFFMIFFICKRWMTYSFLVSGIYTGLFISFYSGVYQSSLAHTSQLSKFPKAVIGLTSICIGVGGLLASTFDLIAKRAGNIVVMLITLVLSITAFFLMFLFIPGEASIQQTDTFSYITPSITLALFCGLILGIIDIIWNVQVSGLINKVYEKNEISSAFSLYKMVQSVSAAIAYVYGGYLQLHWQLLILAVLTFVNYFLLSTIEFRRTKNIINLKSNLVDKIL